jgi:glycosyltransferase involved in cell wall biosynthesis
MDVAQPYLSICVPAYNEAARIGPSLARIGTYLDRLARPAEVVVYDDGSRDNTQDIVRAAGLPNLRLIAGGVNRGKGAGVRAAVLAAQGEYVLFTDADLSTPIDEGDRLLAALHAGNDLAIGVRRHPDGRDMRASQPLYRQLQGRLFRLAVSNLLIRDIEDTQTGFKAFRREAAQCLFSTTTLTTDRFDVEVLYLARRLGYRIAQVPVQWVHDNRSVMRYGWRYALRVLHDLWHIWRAHHAARPVRSEQ